MKKKEGVSILITAFQSQHFIKECLYSLLNQNTNFPFEVLLAVDGCKETLEVSKKIDSVSVFFSEENVGSFVLRNTLAKKAKYENLIFFDSDDISLDGFINFCYNGLQNKDCIRVSYYNFKDIGTYVSGKKQAFGVMGIKKNIFSALNGYKTWRFGADSEFIARAEQLGVNVGATNKHYFLRRVHPNSLTNHPDTGMSSPARIKLKADLIPKIIEKRLSNPDEYDLVNLKLVKKGLCIMNINAKIGIGITTLNRNKQLTKTIAKINEFTTTPFKLVIVDDGSKIPVPEATFRFDKNQGAPIAKNKCLELLDDCDHIFLLDDDTFPTQHGWEQLYIKSGIKHLNYTFKYPFKIVDGVLHFQNPNGCMIYLTRDVLDKVGGFDPGFIKYGYWHGAFSNRVFNAGLIPHPFIDVMGSSKYLHCLDQVPGANKTASPNRGQFLSANKRRYFEKLRSSEYIPYKKEGRIRISYSNPYSTEKNIGKALNEFCENVPDGNWICLQDGDICYLTSKWGKQIEDVIKKNGDDYGLIGCVTNRLGRPIQVVEEMYNEHDMRKHAQKAIELETNHWAEVEDITHKKYIAGMFMLFHKDVWKKCKFKENNIAFDDAFSKDVRKQGYKLGLMKGLYVYHLYRIWSDNPRTDRTHLK